MLPKPTSKEFPVALKRARQQQGRSRAELARRAGIHRILHGAETRTMGVMCESHLNEGRQDLVPGRTPKYAKSITDGCIGWDATISMLEALAESVRTRRAALGALD